MFAWLGKALTAVGTRLAAPAPPPTQAFLGALRSIQARYDAAQNTDENARRWRLTDVLSAKAANSFNVRRTLRMRARYCVANNSYAQGIVFNKVNDLIGTGPTAQVEVGDETANDQIETAWSDWWAAVGGLEKLTTMARAKIVDGEGFFVLSNYDQVQHPVQLYPRDIEADQVTTPQPLNLMETFTDGLVLDKMGNPITWDILRTHPGDFLFPNLNPLEVDTYAARYVVQWFRKDRAGQVRGIPELTPALELFEQMRTFRMATLTAAETAALLTALMKSNLPPDTAVAPAAMSTADLERGLLTALPAGWDISQLKAEHPSTTYEVFVYCLLAEACRCLNVPLNVALGTSQKFNFSSARLDHLNYRDAIKIERRQCEIAVLTRLFMAFLEEAVMIPGLLPRGITPAMVRVKWHWPGWSYLDPLKDAQADTERLNNNTLTYARYFAENGEDWEDEFEQLAAEKEKMEELGLTPEEIAPVGETAGGDADEGDAGDDGGEPATAGARRGRIAARRRGGLRLGGLATTLTAAQEQPMQVVVNVPPITVPPPTVTIDKLAVTVPEQPAPIVNVRVEAPIVNVPEQAAPVVQVAAPNPTPVMVQLPAQPSPQVTVNVPETSKPKTIRVTERNADGSIKRAEVT